MMKGGSPMQGADLCLVLRAPAGPGGSQVPKLLVVCGQRPRPWGWRKDVFVPVARWLLLR